MRTVVAVICVSISFGVFADEYDECVLAGMKGVSSDTGARLVAQACKNKTVEAKKTRRASFGIDLDSKDCSIITGDHLVQRHEDGLVSQAIVNKTSGKTITLVALTVRDGDFYNLKPAGSREKGASRPDPFDGVLGSMERPEWERERTHVYFYKVTIKPGNSIRLKFPLPKSDTFYSEITSILGREPKWTDTMRQITDVVSPEARDPLE